MMIEADKEIKQYKAQLRKLKDDYNRAKGSHDTLMARLKKEFGVDSIADAEELLSEWKKEIEATNKRLMSLLKELENGLS